MITKEKAEFNFHFNFNKIEIQYGSLQKEVSTKKTFMAAILIALILVAIFKILPSSISLGPFNYDTPWTPPKTIIYETKPDLIIKNISWVRVNGAPLRGYAKLIVDNEVDSLHLNVSYISGGGYASFIYYLNRNERIIDLYKPFDLNESWPYWDISICWSRSKDFAQSTCESVRLERPIAKILVEPPIIQLKDLNSSIQTAKLSITNEGDFDLVNWVIFCHAAELSELKYPACVSFVNLKPGESMDFVLEISNYNAKEFWPWDSHVLGLIITGQDLSKHLKDGVIPWYIRPGGDSLIYKNIQLKK